MKLSRTLSLAGLGVVSLSALLAAQGCSSSSSTTAQPGHDGGKTDNDGGSTDNDSGGKKEAAASDQTDAGKPPSAPTKKTTSTKKHNFAIRSLYLGDTNADAPSYTPNTSAWKTFGYNIDGLITTAQSKDVCTPPGGSAAQIDGTNGIDNSFGENVTPEIADLAGSQKIGSEISKGAFSLLTNITGLDGTATQSASGLTAELFAGSTYTETSGTPALNSDGTFAITDNWPVNRSLLTNPSSIADGSKVSFSDAYIANGTFVSGSQDGSIDLSIAIEGISLNLTIHAGVITMPISVDKDNQLHVKTGIVSGVLSASELASQIGTVLARIPSGCSLISVANTVLMGAPDILIDGNTVTNKAGSPCNGISIGLAFDADEIAQPDTIAPLPDAGPAPAACDAGK